MIKIIKDGNYTELLNGFNFPGGEVGISVESDMYPERVKTVELVAHIKNSNDVMKLLMASDAVDRHYRNAKKTLKMPYVPYGRQDRVCNPGEALSIKVFANLINSCNFDLVKIIDPHSDVTPALINNVVVSESHSLFSKNLGEYYILSPDAGAYKKSCEWAKQRGAKGVICANKIRDVRTGKIKKVDVSIPTGADKILVIDDILDAGGTFAQLASLPQFEQAEVETLELFVTHGIFSKGLNGLDKLYDHIYTTNSYHGEVPEELLSKDITWFTV